MDELDAKVSTLRGDLSDTEDEEEEEEEEDDQAIEEVKIMVMKGKTPEDSECKEEPIKACVYSEGDEVYDVMLNRTNIEKNINKFYRIQLLEAVDSNIYIVRKISGRVGPKGQSKILHRGENLQEARKFFKKEFRTQTKNEWENRENFKKLPGKYDLVLIDHNTDEKIQSLLKLIFGPEAVEEKKIDPNKIPLGWLTSKQIEKGKEVLRRIEKYLMRKATNQKLFKACNRFYTRIPHNFGRKRPPVIETEEELEEEKALLEELSKHPLDRLYHSPQYEPKPLDSASNEYKVIKKYLKTTHNTRVFTMTVLDIFSVDKQGEINNFRSDLGNRTLLWYDSRPSDWVSILHQGLHPSTGSNFGEAFYFTDMSSKSGKSCYSNKDNSEGVLLLCEVALGDCHETGDPKDRKLPDGKHSIKILGSTRPKPNKSVRLDDVLVPMGREVTGENYSLDYNHYIVYDPARVRIKYLLRIRFNFR